MRLPGSLFCPFTNSVSVSLEAAANIETEFRERYLATKICFEILLKVLYLQGLQRILFQNSVKKDLKGFLL